MCHIDYLQHKAISAAGFSCYTIMDKVYIILTFPPGPGICGFQVAGNVHFQDFTAFMHSVGNAREIAFFPKRFIGLVHEYSKRDGSVCPPNLKVLRVLLRVNGGVVKLLKHRTVKSATSGEFGYSDHFASTSCRIALPFHRYLNREGRARADTKFGRIVHN